MRGYIAFVKKEFMESVRTYKLLILLIVFLIFGFMSPLFAKLTPQIIASMATEGITMTVPEPSAMDSYAQFFKNCGQMGLLVMVLVFGGMLTGEYTKGTLINVLTKGLSRKAVIFAKFTWSSILWTLALLLSSVTTYGYTLYFFPGDKVYHLLQSVVCLWIFGVFLIAVILFASTLVKSSYACLLMTAIIVAVLFTINIAPVIKHYNPVLLISDNMAMLMPEYDLIVALKAVIITIAATVGLLMAAVVLFDRKKL